MNTLNVEEKLYFKEIEELIKQSNVRNDFALGVPSEIEDKGVFGIEGLLLLLVANWLRYSESRELILSFKESEDDFFESICSSLYGICAIRLCSRLIVNGKPFEKDKALISGYSRVRKVISEEYAEAYGGRYLAVPAIKAKGVNREANNPFYIGDDVLEKDEFRDKFEDIFKSILNEDEYGFVNKYMQKISDMIWELFDNTHKHGRNNKDEDVLEENFRGVIFNIKELDEDKLNSLLSSGVPGVFGFSADWQYWMSKHRKKLPLLDITVVDAGPGYARRWTGSEKTEISFDSEVGAVVQCFLKGSTTSRKRPDGVGLFHVLNCLKAVKGWFRLRTGSVAVSKSFFMENDKKRPSIKPEDVIKAGGFVEGNSFNIVIPLVGYEAKEDADVSF